MNKHIPNIISLYEQKNFKSLAGIYLGMPIDSYGNTIVHIMAKNLDKDAFQEILKYNNTAFNYSIINKPNKKNEFPLHVALESTEKNDISNYEFIKYMIDILGANPEIPDNKNRIIVINNDNKNDTHNQFSMNEKIKNLNKTVINNIKNLTMLINKKNNSNYKDTSRDMTMNSNTNFIKDIVYHYNELLTHPNNKQNIVDIGTKQPFNHVVNNNLLPYHNNNLTSQYGNILPYPNNNPLRQFSNNFRGGNNESKQNNYNDVFKLPDDVKRNIYNNNDNDMFGGAKKTQTNKKSTSKKSTSKKSPIKKTTKNPNRKKMKNIKNDKYNISSDDSSDDNLFGGNSSDFEKINIFNSSDNNDRYNAHSNTNNNKTDTDSNTNNKTNTNNNKTDTESNTNNKTNNNKSNTSKNNDRRIDNNTDKNINDSDTDIKKKNKSKDKYGDYDEKFDYADNSFYEWIESNDNSDDDYDHKNDHKNDRIRHKREKSEKQKKIDDIYRSFIKMIMDFMNVDEDKAKLYRSALKITIEEAHPELKGRQNDELKVKEMENIISNKEKLVSALKKIDLDKIKNKMEQLKSDAEKKRAESNKIKEEKMKNKKSIDTKKPPGTDRPNKSRKDSESPPVTSTESSTLITSTEPPKKTSKKTSKSKSSSSGGYLHTSEVILT